MPSAGAGRLSPPPHAGLAEPPPVAPAAGAAPLVLGSGPLRIADVAAASRGDRPVVFASGVGPRLAAARAVVEAEARRGAAIYGLTTGLGAAVDTALRPEDLAAFQTRAVAARAVAVGGELTPAEARATLFVRLAGLARGASGISPALAETLRDLLNAGIVPIARRTGSLGEADLAILAELVGPLAGGGEAWLGGERLPGPAALARAGIAAPALGPKDGIALINANSFSVAAAALALDAARTALDASILAGALALEAFRANLSVIDERVAALRPAPGVESGAARLRALMAGSDLFEPGRARRVQDPLSFRCLGPVAGFAAGRLAEAERAVEADLDGAGDSPAVLIADGEILSTVGFDTTALALSVEALAAALAHLATLSAFRVTRLMSAEMTGLPRFLARAGGSRTGFATLGKSAAALEAEIRHLALPVGPLAMPVADGVEDYAPLTPQVVAKLGGIVERLRLLAAIELVVAAEAVDARDGVRLGRATAAAHAIVRDLVAPLAEDRATGTDVMRVAAAIAAGRFADEPA